MRKSIRVLIEKAEKLCSVLRAADNKQVLEPGSVISARIALEEAVKKVRGEP